MAQDPNAVADEAAAVGASGINKEKADEIYANLTKQVHVAQANFFLNVYWEKFADKKDTIVAIFERFCDSGEDKSSISSIAFMKVLQDLENDHQLITDFPNDGPSISKKFDNAGIKKKGEIPILGALLAIYEVTLLDTVNLPATPCNAKVRTATEELEAKINQEEDLKKKQKALEDEIEEMKAANASGIKIMRKTEKLQKVVNELDNDSRKVQQTRDVRIARKALEEAQAALTAENESGTDATNWLKQQCGAKHKKFANFEL